MWREAAPRCLALNYAEIRKDAGGYTVTCQRSGQSTQVAPRLIINATGAWLDETVTQLGGACTETHGRGHQRVASDP